MLENRGQERPAIGIHNEDQKTGKEVQDTIEMQGEVGIDPWILKSQD